MLGIKLHHVSKRVSSTWKHDLTIVKQQNLCHDKMQHSDRFCRMKNDITCNIDWLFFGSIPSQFESLWTHAHRKQDTFQRDGKFAFVRSPVEHGTHHKTGSFPLNPFWPDIVQTTPPGLVHTSKSEWRTLWDDGHISSNNGFRQGREVYLALGSKMCWCIPFEVEKRERRKQ